MILGSFCNHFGIIMGSFLGSLWDHFGIILGSFWDHYGIIMGSCWDHYGIIMDSFWDHFGIGRRKEESRGGVRGSRVRSYADPTRKEENHSLGVGMGSGPE